MLKQQSGQGHGRLTGMAGDHDVTVRRTLRRREATMRMSTTARN